VTDIKATMHQISVSVIYATPSKQWLFETSVARGTSAHELIELAGFMNDIEELAERSTNDLLIGIYAEKVDLDYLLEEGDRVEIYRRLTADPKEVRRQLALLGKTIGSK